MSKEEDLPFDPSEFEDEDEEDEEVHPPKEKKSSLLGRIFKGLLQKRKDNIPMTFNVVLSIILFFVYLSIMFVSVPSSPILLVLILPTLYIIVRHIKLERDQLGEKYGH